MGWGYSGEAGARVSHDSSCSTLGDSSAASSRHSRNISTHNNNTTTNTKIMHQL